jgi:DNA-binding transcriptional MocR family regulator
MNIDASWLAAQLRARSTRGIALEMSALIRVGAIPAGSRLPPVRALAGQLGISPATISAAWSELRRFNAIAGRGRTGMRVSGDPIAPRPARYGRGGHFRPGVIDLALASPDPALLLPGSLVAVEEPTAIRLLDLLDAAGATPLPVACDAEGPLPEDLAAALARRPAAFLFQPRTHAVTGHIVSPARMAALAVVLRGQDTLVIEDDGIGDLSAAPPASLGAAMPGRVVHIRSFSKSLGPDFRLAVLSAPPEMVERLHAFRGFGVGWTSRILQAAVAALLTDPGTDTVLATARASYATRRRALLAALAARGIHLPDRDGLAIWLPVRSEQFALVTLAAHNIAVIAGSACTTRSSAHVRVATSLLTGQPDKIADALALAAAGADKAFFL